MKFSLINVHEEQDGKIAGSWIQNVIGTIDDARKAAVDVARVNGNKIKVAVVDEIPSSNPMLGYWHNLKAL